MVIDLRSILTKVRDALAIFAALTKTKSDDEAVAALNAFLSADEFLDYLQGYLDQPEGTLSLTAPPAALTMELERRGINWQRVLEMLPQIISLIRLFSGK